MNNPFGLIVYADPFEADDFNEAHNCAACWGVLRKEKDLQAREWLCLCENCGENTRGYVTAKYVARRIKKNEEEAFMARSALRPFVPWMQEKRTVSQNLQELGF